MPPHEWTDKERLMRFIARLIPDDFKCKHFSVTFNEDDSASIYISNNYDDDKDDDDDE